jgi:Helix-hairpin-helix motif
MLKAISLLFVLSYVCNKSLSQEIHPDPSETVRSIIESMEESGRLPEDFSDLLDNLASFREKPLNLNQAERADLEKFLFLTDFQVQSLLDYRREHGPFLTLYELQLVIGFDSTTIAYLLPYVSAGESETHDHLVAKDIIRKGDHEIFLKEQRVLQTPEGYREIPDTVPLEKAGSRYAGSRDRLLVRYRYQVEKKLYCGLTMEKDAGEEFFTGSNPYGFDFYSGYLQINNLGPFKSLLAGDFQITTGQGLTLGTGSAYGGSFFPSTLYRRQEPLKKYGSTDESLFLRGIAVSVAAKKFTFLAFFSRKSMDANVTDTLASGEKVFSSFRETNYHRTVSEITDEKVISETAIGGSVIYKNRWLKIGSTMVRYLYSGTKQKPDELYRKYEFWGDRLWNAGLDYSMSFRKLQLFGETSWGNNAFATLNGALLNAHPLVSLSLLYRYYDPQYYARYSSAVSQNTRPCNENAFYIGSSFHPVKFLNITAYADFFRFPWMTYAVRQPSSGSEFFVQADLTVQKNLSLYMRFSDKSSGMNYTADDSPIKVVQDQKSNAVRLHCSYQVSQNLQLRSRVEYKIVTADSIGKAEGFMFYQDLVYRFSRIPVQLSMRYMFYRTDNYAARIFAYEDDVLYSYSIPAFYDEGNRSYLMVRYDICKNLTFWLKWGQTVMDDASTLGTGPDEIEGNAKSEIKLQVRWIF